MEGFFFGVKIAIQVRMIEAVVEFAGSVQKSLLDPPKPFETKTDAGLFQETPASASPSVLVKRQAEVQESEDSDSD